MNISKFKLRNFLADRVTQNLSQAQEKDLYEFIRYEGIKGLEDYSDKELFILLQESIPEFELIKVKKSDNNNYYLEVKAEHKENADDIEIDIKRIIQMKMLA